MFERLCLTLKDRISFYFRKQNSHSAFVGITAASLPSLRPIFKLISGEKVSQFFSQLLSKSSRFSSDRSSSNKPGSSKSKSLQRLHSGDSKEGNKMKSLFLKKNRPEAGGGKNNDAVIIKMNNNNRTTTTTTTVEMTQQHHHQHQQQPPRAPPPDISSQLSLLLPQNKRNNNSVHPRDNSVHLRDDKRRFSCPSSIESTRLDLESGAAPHPLDR